MAEVKNNSSINITRTDLANKETVNLGNKLFNGYIYSMSLDVGFDGNPSSLVLNLALNKTLKQALNSVSIQTQRKKDISFLNKLNASKNTQTTPRSQINNQSSTYVGTSKTLSQLIDNDFLIEEQYIGATTSYNIVIVDSEGKKTYSLKNFKISSYSLSKRNNEKILTVTLKDNSFVLDKIFVAILGEQVAMDKRSEQDALVNQVILNCPSGNGYVAGAVTASNFIQRLHFAEKQLGEKLKIDPQTTQVIVDTTKGPNKSNYIILKSTDPLKQIINGYGAIIILGEEDFKDSPCKSSEIYYSFKSLLVAMKALGIEISKVTDSTQLGGKGSSGSTGSSSSAALDSLRDKSGGQIKRKHNGTLKNVLAQWCEEYSYSYTVDFSAEGNKLVIKGIDLTDSVSKEAVLMTKLNLENLEASDDSGFVVRSQDFNFDISKKNLKLYSSLYYKDARDKTLDFEQILGNRQIKNIKLYEIFPQLFATGDPATYDFSGAKRTYDQVVTSAILGKYAPNLREIYNYSIGAYEALGFLPLGGDATASRLNYLDNDNLIAYEAVSRALELQSELVFNEYGKLLINMNLGFYNESLASNILSIESFIADFIGKHYWTDVLNVQDGIAGNEDVLMKYAVETVPPTQKVYANELYKLPVFKEASFLLASIASLFNGTESYFKAFSEFNRLKANVDDICKTATQSYLDYINDLSRLKPVRFYQQRGDATYGIFKELVRGLEYFDYFLSSEFNPGSNSSTKLTRVNLSEAYSPIFKELSPVTLGVLQSALRVNVTNIPLGNYSFGVMFGFTGDAQIYGFEPRIGNPVFTNPIEYQNSIAETCTTIRDLIAKGNINSLQTNRKDCSKTIFYSICVLPKEQNLIQENASAQLNGLGPDATRCRRISVSRKMPTDAFVLAHVSKSIQSNNGVLSLEAPALTTIFIQSARFPNPTRYDTAKNRIESEFIVLPSEQTYIISLRSKSSTQTTLPFKNFIRGGLEDPKDISKILNNEGFSLEIDVNNITPNLRELFADETEQSYSNDQIINSPFGDGTPVVMTFRGYSLDSKPEYEFNTFQTFHNNIKAVYDSAASSLLQPSVSYSADLFCSSISESLKSLLSVNNGLSKLNINIVENGLTIQCSFESSPSKQINLQNLIYKNRPNIKLINTNFFN
jgi:hypothetical protein